MTFKTYFFGLTGESPDGDATMTALLGGKGAHLAEMSGLGLPVPPGFTLPTTICGDFLDAPVATMADVMPIAMAAYERLVANGPRLVSVRSGAPVSMPGMMNTILNVGVTKDTFPHWIATLGERTAFDCRRRLIQMLGETAFHIPMHKFEAILTRAKFAAKVKEDSELSAASLLDVCLEYLILFYEATGQEFPETIEGQLQAAIGAVFHSWHNERAKTYRELNGIPESMGTAVTVQTMVFGNLNNQSGSGVLFTRHPSTGAPQIMGEYLPNAQGEDVVAGIRTPLSLSELNKSWPAIGAQIASICLGLETHYRDMMDVEFTVENGTLFILQCRVGKRSPLAKLVIALDFHTDKVITLDTVLGRLTRSDIKSILRPQIDPAFKTAADWTGLAGSTGVVSGVVVLSSEEAIAFDGACVLVTEETNPNDIGGMAKSVGILTKTGGATCHAAVVARAMDKPCVVGCTDLPPLATLKGRKITVDGSTGRVWIDIDVPVIDATNCAELFTLARLIADNTGQRVEVTMDQLYEADLTLPNKVAAVLPHSSFMNSESIPCADVAIDIRPVTALEEDGGLGDLMAWTTASDVTSPHLPVVPPPNVKFVGTAAQANYWKKLPFLVSTSTVLEALDDPTLVLTKNALTELAKTTGADPKALFAALQTVPTAKPKELRAAPPAYIVLSAVKE